MVLVHTVVTLMAVSYCCYMTGRINYIDRTLAKIKEEISPNAIRTVMDTRKEQVKKVWYCVLFMVFYVAGNWFSLAIEVVPPVPF